MPSGCFILSISLTDYSKLNSCFFFNCQLTSVITASAAYSVINMPLSTIWANCQCRSYCFIMSSSLCSSCFRLSSLRMCHFLLNFNYYLIFFLNHSNADRFVLPYPSLQLQYPRLRQKIPPHLPRHLLFSDACSIYRS